MPSLGVSCRSTFTGTGALCGEKQLHFGGRHFHKKSAGQWDDSEEKGVYCQTWGPKLDVNNPQGGRREAAPARWLWPPLLHAAHAPEHNIKCNL